MMRRVAWRVVTPVAVIVLVGAWLRSRGLAFGLPAVYNMDEAAIMSRTLALAVTGPNPHNFLYPSFYFYALFVWLGGFFLVARVSGMVTSLRAFEDSFFIDPSAIYLAGRAFSVVMGTATLVAVFSCARRIAGTAAGLAACGFLAVAPFAVQDSHYVKHDIPVTLIITLAQYAMVGALLPGTGNHSGRWLLAAAVLSGLATSTHYYAVFLAVPLALAAVWSTPTGQGWLSRGGGARVAVAGGVMAAAFVAASPFLLVSFDTALRDVTANRAIVIDRAAAGGGWLAGAHAYGTLLFRDAIGWPVVLLALVGAGLTARRTPRVAAILLAFPVVFFAFICRTVVATRYLNPMLPTIALFAGIAVAALVTHRSAGESRDRARGRAIEGSWQIRQWLAAVLLVAAAALPGLVASWRLGSFFDTPDTRALAEDFIEQTVPSGTTVLIQPYSVSLRQSQDGLREALSRHLGDPAGASAKFARQLALDPYPEPSYRLLWLGDGGLDQDKIYLSPGDVADRGLEWLRRHDVELIVLKRYNDDDPVIEPLVADLHREAALVATFSPYRDEVGTARTQGLLPFLHNTDARVDHRLARPGPIIDIWRLTAR
jgi:hypothetical protein